MKKVVIGIFIGIAGLLLIIAILFYWVARIDSPDTDTGIRMVQNDSTETTNEKPKQQMLVYGDYMDLDSTDYLLIPLGMKVLDHTSSDRGLKFSSGEGYGSDDNGSFRSYKYNFYSLSFGNCNNIIFYNKKNDQTHLLLQKPAIISEFYFPYYDNEYKGEKYWFILLGIHEEDTNKDGFINEEDAEKVYISNLSGDNLKQITPDKTQLIDWFIDTSTNNILMQVRFDSNRDNKFDMHDEIEILKTPIRNPTLGKAIIGKKIKNDIKRILNQIK